MSKRVHRTDSRPIFLVIAAALAAVTVAGVVLVAQARRDFTVVARKYAFSVAGSNTAEIHVQQNDLVHVTFSTEDIPHSFTINEYRIMRRAEPGKPVSFDFRADRPGRFRFYCSLTIDEKCRDMQGFLVVDPAK
ncbi:MAG TPA: cupredoxin domain-containing protein [Vicinamibacterales bacterium]|nr:cupredoxin domain-containing protein [Vicinamibacterales bacterium]